MQKICSRVDEALAHPMAYCRLEDQEDGEGAHDGEGEDVRELVAEPGPRREDDVEDAVEEAEPGHDHAHEYFRLLDQPEVHALGLGLPLADFKNSNWHMFQVVLPQNGPSRAAVIENMTALGISTGVHWLCSRTNLLSRSGLSSNPRFIVLLVMNGRSLYSEL